MLIIFLVIVTDLIGFGIMVPILAYYALQLGGGPELATFCMSLYAIGMFIASPILGRMSDRYGRRPVLLISMLGASAGYLLLGFSESILIVAISRLFSGFMAGNLAAAQAYVTDITTLENRAKGMGMIGAAFGLGFIIGPALGSYLAGDNFETANLFLPAMVSAGLSATAFFIVLFFLPESLDQEHRLALRGQPRVNQWQAFKKVAQNHFVLQFLVGALFYNIAAGFVEAIFPIWVKDTGVAMGPKDLMPLLLVAGILLSIVQGVLIGPLTKAFGERRLLQVGAIFFSLSTIASIWAGSESNYYAVMAALVLQTVSAALVITSMQSLVSMEAEATERGLVLGIYAASGTLGRIIGTILTGIIFANINIHGSYVMAGFFTFLLFLLAVWMRPFSPQGQESAAESAL